MIDDSLKKLCLYVESNNYKGYDPYDTLNMRFNIGLFGNYASAIAIQVQKRNPINIRHILGIRQEYNPKGMGLFLKAYCLLYQKTNNIHYLNRATQIFDWLKTNYSKGHSGYAWGYNFPWASPEGFIPAYTPSVVVTSFVIDGIFNFYKITEDDVAKELILGAADYVSRDIPITTFPKGISYSYTHLMKDCCYNASLLAAEVLAISDSITQNNIHQTDINLAIDFVVSKQKESGEWLYSLDMDSGIERTQIDFHQGFVLNSLYNINNLLTQSRIDIKSVIDDGLRYYKNKQFSLDGRSFWRIPKKWPTDIHHQAQGIITFSKYRKIYPEYFNFAHKIADWTIQHMQSNKGYFYYHKNPFYTNKISYIRWAQAWMMLALAELLYYNE